MGSVKHNIFCKENGKIRFPFMWSSHVSVCVYRMCFLANFRFERLKVLAVCVGLPPQVLPGVDHALILHTPVG